MRNLLNSQKLFSLAAFIFFFMAFNPLKAQITCPYPLDNQTGCPSVIITYELLDNTCVCPPGCGPWAVSTPPRITLLGTVAQCSSSGVDIIIHVDQVGSTFYSVPFVCVDGGCSWGPTDSGTEICSTSGNWTTIWSSTGAVIMP